MELSVEDDLEVSPLASRALFASIKFNIFTFILLLFSTNVIYMPLLREYAKLGFSYANTILIFSLIFSLISFAIISSSTKREKN